MDIERLRTLAGTQTTNEASDELIAYVNKASKALTNAADMVSTAYEMLGMPEEGDEAAGMITTYASELESATGHDFEGME